MRCKGSYLLRSAKIISRCILVVGSSVLRPIKRIFVGTVSDYCAKHVECSDILVKQKVEDTPEDPIDD
ncbi:hypothetical protein SUGI_0626360 [Cryptomeria japonica]|nr:hypothetical protein SUGI_0626360 [Cryptomeria japonica]